MYKLDFIKEISTKYFNTYFLIKKHALDTGKICIIQGYNWDFDEGKPNFENYLNLDCVVTDGEVKSSINLDLSNYILDLSIPDIGFYNTEYSVMFLRRKFYRQWKRSLSPNNTDYYNLHIASLQKYSTSNLFDVYKSIINGRFLSVIDSIESVLSGNRLHSAFCENFCVGINDIIKNSIVLYYRNISIGVIDKSENGYIARLPEKAAHFVEDLERFLPVECS